MNEITVRAIILRETPYNEADKVITLFAKDIGKMSVYCRGARKTKSKVLAASSVFSYADFTLTVSQSGYWLKSAEMIESFYRLRTDIAKLSYAAYFAELAEYFITENNPANDQMYLLLKALQKLCRGEPSNRLIARLYELKLIQLSGFMPVVDGCCDCGDTDVSYICAEGLLCESCKRERPRHTVKISMEIVYILIYIFQTDTKNLFQFGLSLEYEEIFEKITKLLVFENFGLKLKTYDFLQDNYI